MQQVRVFFKKKGNMKYISHLDLVRAVTRSLMRTGLPIHYTEGFNPHPKLVFAVPLSIYQESEYEMFDIGLDEDHPYKEITKRMKAAFPKGIEIIDTAEPVIKFKELSKALYKISFITDLSVEEITGLLSGKIVVLKKTKSKEEEKDISSDFELQHVYPDKGRIAVEALLSAGSENYLNPQYIVDFLSGHIREEKILRLCLYDKTGKALR